MYRTEPSPIAPLILAASMGRVIAYARTDGRIVWSHGPEVVFRSGDRRPTRMEIHGSRVFVLVGRRHEKLLGDSYSTEITALDYDTGRVLWTQPVSGKSDPVHATLFVDADQVVVSHAGLLHTFATDDGARRWSRRSDHSDGDFQPGLELGVPGYTARRPSE